MRAKECGQPEGAEGLLADNQQGNRDFSPTATRNYILPTTQMSWEEDSFAEAPEASPAWQTA